jgi:hypothetical protein
MSVGLVDLPISCCLQADTGLVEDLGRNPLPLTEESEQDVLRPR